MGSTFYKAPESAFRQISCGGIGVEEALIRFLGAPQGKRLRLPFTFISYSFQDSRFATKLHRDLQRSGLRCWLAERSMDIGEAIEDTIAKTIANAGAVIVILSRASVESAWVRTEIRDALAKEKQSGAKLLFPVLIDEEALLSRIRWVAIIRKRKSGDFRRWRDRYEYVNAIEELLTGLGVRSVSNSHPLWREDSEEE